MICRRNLSIELISNLICGSGEGWGNIIDTDSTHDEYGLPYIPARRIKGLLKEAAEELEDFGVLEKNTAKKLFGSDSADGHYFTLYNACLKNADDMKREIENAPENVKKYLMPVNINNHYTKVYYHTAIDDSGIAKEHSLRSVRAVDKGLIFYAPIEFEDKDEDILKKCVAMVRHMGINRTRGYGEVKLRLEETKSSMSAQTSLSKLEDDQIYSIKLYMTNRTGLSIVGTNGSDTLDYISGSSMLGFFANRYLKENEPDSDFYRLFLKGDVIFHNAYISDEKWNEYMPIRQSLYKQKTGKKYYDKSYERPSAEELLSKVNNKYLTENFVREVKEEIVYHHRRPDDKAIGHVVSNDRQGDGTLYQKEVISADQRFVGRVTGKGKDLKKALLCSIPAFLQLGSSRRIQYGNVEVNKTEVEIQKKEKIKKGTEVVCTLLSPLLLIDEKGESIVDVKKLGEALKLDGAEYYVDYAEIGGYNAKWRLQKPFYIAYAKGSCVRGILQEDVERERIIGALQGEGLGQVRADLIGELPTGISSVLDCQENSRKETVQIILTKSIVVNEIKKEMRLTALESIKTRSIRKVITPSLLGRLLKMMEKDNWDQFYADYMGIAQEDKRSAVSQCIKEMTDECDKIIKDSNLEEYIDVESYRNQFYLQTLRDLFTQEKVNRREV